MNGKLYSWKDGLTLLLPRNLKLFALVTLKSIIECYKIYFKYFWWVPVIALAHAFAYAQWLHYMEPFSGLLISSAIPLRLFLTGNIIFALIERALFGFNIIVGWLAVWPSIDP